MARRSQPRLSDLPLEAGSRPAGEAPAGPRRAGKRAPAASLESLPLFPEAAPPPPSVMGFEPESHELLDMAEPEANDRAEPEPGDEELFLGTEPLRAPAAPQLELDDEPLEEPGDAPDDEDLARFAAPPPRLGPRPVEEPAPGPAPVEIAAPLAARIRAAVANLVVYAGLAALVWLGLAAMGISPRERDLPALALFLLAFSFLYTVIPLAFWGQTPGMVWAGLVARCGDRQPLAFGQTTRRWLGGLLTIALAGLPGLLALWGGSLTDRLSGSTTRLRESRT